MIEKLIESMKKRLKEKGVSLIMMFDIGGEIVWSMGRDIKGDRIEKGSGFSKTACKKAIEEKGFVKGDEELLKISGDGLSDTATSIMIKSILIYPVDDKRFFYVDTIEKEFTEDDIITIRESCYYLREWALIKKVESKKLSLRCVMQVKSKK